LTARLPVAVAATGETLPVMDGSTIGLGDERFAVAVAPGHGARLASLVVAGRERLVTRSDDSLGWGAYPMVPFAGRLRDGVLVVDGRDHRFPLHSDGHAIHGTVHDAPWRTVSRTGASATFETELVEPWPFGGTVAHTVEVDAEARTVRCRLAVRAAARPMPVQVGWHPWFAGYESLAIDFESVLLRDVWGIPDGTTGDEPAPGRRDDCFTGVRSWPRVGWSDGWSVQVESTCSHWVVYDVPVGACCVEPQSGAPNDLNVRPEVVPPGGVLEHEMVLRALPPVIGNT
jgi:aldose 1-epimerase